MNRTNLLDLLGGLLTGEVPHGDVEYLTQLEDNIHMPNITAANLTQFMRNVRIFYT